MHTVWPTRTVADIVLDSIQEHHIDTVCVQYGDGGGKIQNQHTAWLVLFDA